MPEPYQPVDHWVASRLVPLNSASNLSAQSPGTPAGVGVRLGVGVGVDVDVRHADPTGGRVRRGRIAHIATGPGRHTRTLRSGKRETLLPFLGWPQLLMIWV